MYRFYGNLRRIHSCPLHPKRQLLADSPQILEGIHCILPGGAEPRPYQLRLHFNGFCVKQTVYGLRVYLKTPNAPGQRAFLRCAASFFLEIRQYSCEKMSCATQKSLAAGHIMSFQIHPKLMTLPFRGSPGKLRGWQTFRRAYRLSPGHAPRGLVQTTGTAGGYD